MKIKFHRYLLPVLISGLLSTACMHASSQVKAPPAFSTRSITADVPADLQGRGVRRVRAVEINLDLFSGAPPKTTEMNFFQNVDLTVEWTKAEKVERPTGIVWTGMVVGFPLGQATMVVSGRNVTGNITRSDGLMYQIRTTADGRWWVREIDQKDFPRE